MELFTTSDTSRDFPQGIGRWLLCRFRLLTDLTGQFVQFCTCLVTTPSLGNPAIKAVLLKQIYFTGLEAWKIIVVVALILGTVIVSQVVGLVGTDNGSLTGKVLVWVVLRELAPLLTAMIVIARSGTAIATELGSMKINREIDTLELMGIPAERYLILPRIMGVTTSICFLTAYFVLTSFIGSFLIVSVGRHIPYDQFLQGISLLTGTTRGCGSGGKISELRHRHSFNLLSGRHVGGFQRHRGAPGRHACCDQQPVYRVSAGRPDYLSGVIALILP